MVILLFFVVGGENLALMKTRPNFPIIHQQPETNVPIFDQLKQALAKIVAWKMLGNMGRAPKENMCTQYYCLDKDNFIALH